MRDDRALPTGLLTRRSALRLAGAALAAPVLAGCGPDGLLGGGGEGEQVDTTGRVRFDRPLAIPPLAASNVDDAGRRVFELSARPGRREFVPGRATGTWGFNGDYLGPTLRVRRGEQVAVNVHNELPETTTVHWHGMHLPARADGGPHQPIEPGGTWSPSWQIDQPAATLWYHPHPHGATERHVYRGLAGLVIVDDQASAGLGLPREYGIDDIPVIVQDKRFGRDGAFVEGERGPTGMLGDTLLVNGTLGPYLNVRTERVRLRLLNASTARVYAFGLADRRRFALVGTDGGLLAAPYLTDRIQLSPAERAEIVVSLVPGERVALSSFPPDLGTNRGMTRRAGGADSFDVLELRAAASLPRGGALPERLAEAPGLATAGAAEVRRFRLAGRTINGRKMRMDRIDEVVTTNTTEVWEVTNEHSQPHNFHVHGVQLQVVTVGGGRPPPELAGWKDTVYLPPSVPVRLALRFGNYADPDVPYMYHCHLLLHEDLGMMGQFVVTEPGQQAGSIGPAGRVGPGHDHGG